MTESCYQQLLCRFPDEGQKLLAEFRRLGGLEGLTPLESCLFCGHPSDFFALGNFVPSSQAEARIVRWLLPPGRADRALLAYSVCGACFTSGLGPAEAEQYMLDAGRAAMAAAGVPSPIDRGPRLTRETLYAAEPFPEDPGDLRLRARDPRGSA